MTNISTRDNINTSKEREEMDMTREQCEKKIENIRKNTTRNGIFINKILFLFSEWVVDVVQFGILIRTIEDGGVYQSIYIPFEDIIEIK